MKKYLLCVALLVLSAVSFHTAGAKECGGSKAGYTISSSGVLTLDSDCTSIIKDGFFPDNSIVSVDFSKTSLTSIGDSAFLAAQKLVTFDISNTSITSIGEYAIAECPNLTSIKLPTSLTSIGEAAFSESPKLASVDLSNTSVTDIGSFAFYNLKNPSTITVKKGSKAHELLGGSKGTSAVTGDPIDSSYAYNFTTLIIADPSKPTPLPSTPTPEPGTVSGAADMIRVVPLPEDEYGSYELDPVTGEKNYLLFHTYDICMSFLNNDPLCSGYERCYHK